jgi:hypothetical protein
MLGRLADFKASPMWITSDSKHGTSRGFDDGGYDVVNLPFDVLEVGTFLLSMTYINVDYIPNDPEPN